MYVGTTCFLRRGLMYTGSACISKRNRARPCEQWRHAADRVVPVRRHDLTSYCPRDVSAASRHAHLPTAVARLSTAEVCVDYRNRSRCQVRSLGISSKCLTLLPFGGGSEAPPEVFNMELIHNQHRIPKLGDFSQNLIAYTMVLFKFHQEGFKTDFRGHV